MSRKKTNELETSWTTPKSNAYNFSLIRHYFDYKTGKQNDFVLSDQEAFKIRKSISPALVN